MSDSVHAVGYEVLVGSDSMTLPVPVRRGPDLVYEELNGLAELMPERYADVFRFRWGLDGHFPHLTMQTARKFQIPKGTAEEMLTRCLWNIARYAHSYELPAVRKLLGERQTRWAARAWGHAERRWGNDESSFSETVLLLAAGGVDVPAKRTSTPVSTCVSSGYGATTGGGDHRQQLSTQRRQESRSTASSRR